MSHPEAETAALAVMQAHISALNARDNAAIAATLHFPHYRLAEGHLKVWEAPDSYFADFSARAGDDWSHSAWGDLTILRSSPDKVHIDVLVERYSADDHLTVSFRSLWVIARLDGRWAAQLRSSFAPDSTFASRE